MATESALDSWRLCPRCGAELEHGRGKVECPDCELVVHANPAPTASAIVLDDNGRILLAKRAGEPGAGKWDILGGFIEEGEEALETLRRELKEETALEIEPEQFLGGFPDRYGDGGVFTVNFYWTARIRSGEPTPGDDVTEVRWFDPDALPAPEEFAFANTVEVLNAWIGGRPEDASR
jgi:8-oxo-dGTP diphosphatase